MGLLAISIEFDVDVRLTCNNRRFSMIDDCSTIFELLFTGSYSTNTSSSQSSRDFRMNISLDVQYDEIVHDCHANGNVVNDFE